MKMLDQLLALDQDLFLWINLDWSHPWFDLICPRLTHLGGRTAGFVFLLAVLAATRSRRIFFLAGLSYAANAAVFKALKYTILRARPHQLSQAVLRMDPSLSLATDPSFPSGHAAIAFMMAVFFSWRYPRWSPLFFALAFMVGLTRVYLGLHYPSDVLAGAAVGLGSTLGVLAWGLRGKTDGHGAGL